MKKYILIFVLVAGCSYYLNTLYDEWHYREERIALIKKLSESKAIRIEGSVGPTKVVVDIEEETSWDLIYKAVATILSTSLGLALIRKYVK